MAGTTITEAHFGGHLIRTKDSTDPNGPFVQGTLDPFGHSYLRYPGGTVTEELSHRDGSLDSIFEPGTTDPTGNFQVSAHDAFALAREHNIAIQWVMPSETFLTIGAFGERTVDTEAMEAHIDDMMAFFSLYPDVVVASVEIGNEYWYGGERMSPEEYALIADAAAVMLQDAFDAHLATPEGAAWSEPGIAVQSGASWRPGENEAILNGLSMDARAAIDLVVAHYYPGSFENASARGNLFDNINAFRDAPGFGDVKAFLSEWNIHNVEAGDKGFAHASGLLESFDVMLSEGVEVASVWGTNYKNLGTRLSGTSANPDGSIDPSAIATWLTPAGEVYRMMQESLIGKTRAPSFLQEEGLDTSLAAQGVESWAYEGDEETILFIASRSGDPITLAIDPSEWAPDGAHVWAMELEAVDLPGTSRDESQADEAWARARVETHTREDLEANGVTLAPYGIVRITITHNPENGIVLRGGDQDTGGDVTDDDHLVGAVGNDLAIGNHGDDTLEGMGGNDALFGGAGDDVLEGGAGADALFGGSGTNTVDVGEGDAFVWMEGNDLVRLGDGAATLGMTTTAIGRIEGYDPTRDALLLPDGGAWSVADGDAVWTHADGGALTIAGGAGFEDGWTDGLRPWSDGAGRLEDAAGVLGGLGTQALMETLAAAPGFWDGVPPEAIDSLLPAESAWAANHTLHPDHESVHSGPDAPDGLAQDDEETGTDGDGDGDADGEDEEAEDGGKSPCFVASCAFGDAAHPDVDTLRRWRSNRLMGHAPGRLFVAAYWRVGPVLARALAPHPRIKAAARSALSWWAKRLRKDGI